MGVGKLSPSMWLASTQPMCGDRIGVAPVLLRLFSDSYCLQSLPVSLFKPPNNFLRLHWLPKCICAGVGKLLDAIKPLCWSVHCKSYSSMQILQSNLEWSDLELFFDSLPRYCIFWHILIWLKTCRRPNCDEKAICPFVLTDLKMCHKSDKSQ